MSEELAIPAIQPRNPGWFKPGGNPNPGGRPKSAKIISDEISRLLHQGNGAKIAQQLIRLALHAKQEAVQVKAASMIVDRMEGTAVQSIQLSQTIDEATANRLVEIGVMLQRIMPLAHVSNVTHPVIAAELCENRANSSDIALPENASVSDLPQSPAKRKYVRSGKYVGVNKRRKSKDVKNMRELRQPKARMTYEYTVSTGVTAESTDPTDQSAG